MKEFDLTEVIKGLKKVNLAKLKNINEAQGTLDSIIAQAEKATETSQAAAEKLDERAKEIENILKTSQTAGSQVKKLEDRLDESLQQHARDMEQIRLHNKNAKIMIGRMEELEQQVKVFLEKYEKAVAKVEHIYKISLSKIERS